MTTITCVHAQEGTAGDPWRVRECEEARAANVEAPCCSPGIHLFPETELVVEPEDASDSQAGGAEDEQIAQ